MTKILIVDDERAILDVLEAYFKKEDWDVYFASDGSEALKKITTVNPDLVILDLMLPDINGEEVCRLIRKDSDVSIIMLTAKASEDDLIHGIDIGADDYVTKPFSPREVVVRVKALLRRTEKQGRETNQLYRGDLTINMPNKEVLKKGEAVTLTPNEFRILAVLAKHPGRVYSRADLLERIQEDSHYFEGYERSIDTHIKNIRKKIEDNTRNPSYILTVFGMGYKFGGTHG